LKPCADLDQSSAIIHDGNNIKLRLKQPFARLGQERVVVSDHQAGSISIFHDESARVHLRIGRTRFCKPQPWVLVLVPRQQLLQLTSRADYMVLKYVFKNLLMLAALQRQR
jgi:hypothetical protein